MDAINNKNINNMTVEHINKKKHEGRSKEELEKELHELKMKLKVAKCQLQQNRSQMELQSIRTRQIVMAWQSRIEDVEDKCRKYKLHRDKELKDISSQLLFFRGQLRKEQHSIQTEMAAKNKIISDQSKVISKLTNENMKLNDMLTITKQLKASSFCNDDLQESLENLTRYDSGLGFQNRSDSFTEDTTTREFQEFQKAYDNIKSRHNTKTSINSQDEANLTMTSDFISDPNITQDDVFENDLVRSYPDLVMNTGVSKKSSSSKSDISHIKHDMTVEYANPKLIRRKKKKRTTGVKQQTPDYVYQVKCRHMSIDLDKSFDSVKFSTGANSTDQERHWYSDDHLEDQASISNFSKAGDDVSVHNFDRKQGSSFFRDIFNNLRHKTIRIKRKRSKSVSSTSKMPVIFLSQSVPDIPHAEVNIDEAIARKQKKMLGK